MSKAQAKRAMALHARRGISLKSAWAIVKRGGGSTAKTRGRGGKKRRHGGGGYRSYVSRARGAMRGARVPITISYLAAGGAAEIFNLAPAQRQKFFAGLSAVATSLGVTMKIDGYTVAAALIALNGIAALSPWAAAKINGFLARFYARL